MARIIIIGLSITSIFLTACNHESRADKAKRWKHAMSGLKTQLDSLQIENEDTQSFIESAEVHQVTRSAEEKAQQLKNLKESKSDIESQIGALEMLIHQYKDSINSVQ